ASGLDPSPSRPFSRTTVRTRSGRQDAANRPAIPAPTMHTSASTVRPKASEPTGRPPALRSVLRENRPPPGYPRPAHHAHDDPTQEDGHEHPPIRPAHAPVAGPALGAAVGEPAEPDR